MTDITKAETTLLYEILGMYQIGTYDWYEYITWPGGVATSVPFGQQIDFSTANTRLDAIITAINAADSTDGRRERISAVLAEYSAISLDTARISSGGGAGQPGARYDPSEQRAHLKYMLETLLGFKLRKGALEGFNIAGTWRGALR